MYIQQAAKNLLFLQISKSKKIKSDKLGKVILSSIDFLRKRKKYLHKKKQFERINHYLIRIFLAAALMLLCVIIGIVGFMTISGYNLLDAFYMTVITVSTVGYGEIQPLNFWGRLFASFLILTNIGIFTYGISILSRLLLEGDLRKMLDDYKVYKKI